MRLSLPTVSAAHGRVRVQAVVEAAGVSQPLWYEVDETYASGLVPNRIDGFAVVAHLMAMERGERELVLEGEISQRLLYNLTSQIGPLLCSLVPGLREVPIVARIVSDASRAQPTPAGVVTGFSGGIDSFSTIAEHLDPQQTPAYRLTHLVFSNVGSHGHGETGRALFEQRWNLVRPFGAARGLPFVRIDSNVDDLLVTPFEQSHVLRNVSAVLMLQGLFGRDLYSSTYRFEDCHFQPQSDLGHADPAVVPLLSTERFESVSTGCEHTRVEKTRIALQVPECRTMLNVCTTPLDDGRNCSRCWKCLRTLVTLELLGELERCVRVFDLDGYRLGMARAEYLIFLKGRLDDPFIREIAEFARTPEARLPAFAERVHRLWPALAVPYGVAKHLKALRPARAVGVLALTWVIALLLSVVLLALAGMPFIGREALVESLLVAAVFAVVLHARPLVTSLGTVGTWRSFAVAGLFTLVLTGQAVRADWITYPFVYWGMYTSPNPSPTYYEFTAVRRTGGSIRFPFKDIAPAAPRAFMDNFIRRARKLEVMSLDDPNRASEADAYQRLFREIAAIYNRQHAEAAITSVTTEKCTFPTTGFVGRRSVSCAILSHVPVEPGP